jgi:SM-20-related protein
MAMPLETLALTGRPEYSSDAFWTGIVDSLVERGWSQQDFFLPEDLTTELATECRTMTGRGSLKRAGTGRGATQAVRPDIRGDRIRWLQAGQSAVCDRYLQIMERLRIVLNQSLYLGLDEYESHFALYPPGAAYLRHLDRFQDDDRRTVSAVIYLNPDWMPEEGGALRLYPPGGDTEDIMPCGGRLVLFLSADMPHEVLPATRDRISLAGWFRRRH